ncbi:polyketide synthase, partial [Candidatus Thiomargarita nelsonii]
MSMNDGNKIDKAEAGSCIQRRLKWKRLNGDSNRDIDTRIAVLSTFTAYPLEPYLGFALHDKGFNAEILNGPYNQIMQQCLDDQSETAQYRPDILVIWPRFEDIWYGSALPFDDDFAQYSQMSEEIVTVSLVAAHRWGCQLIFVLPVIPETRLLGAGDAGGIRCVFSTASRLRELMRQRLASKRKVFIVDSEEAVRYLGVAGSYNYRLQGLARIPYREELFNFVGERCARLVDMARDH